MRNTIICVIILFLQIYLLLHSSVPKTINPFLVLGVSLMLPAFYFWCFVKERRTTIIETTGYKRNFIGIALGIVLILCFMWSLRALFWEFPDYEKGSDVIPAINALYDRFARGEQPYAPLEQFSWHPYPLYLPLYWLPVGVVRMLEIDTRWTGVFMLILAGGVYGYCCWKTKANIILKMLALTLPVWGLMGYLKWARFDLAVTFEFIIAAYYLVLASGLATRNLVLTMVGVICCLLSRFTLVFWMPLFVVLLWTNIPKKQVLICAGITIAAIVFIYIVPFLSRDYSTFLTGLDYHRHCGISEWEGYGTPPVSWTFESGIHFAEYFRDNLTGTMEERVTLTQKIQSIMMLVTLAISFVLYRKWKDKINFYDYSLPFLYVFMLLYFITAPLTFKYYYFPLTVVSGVLCAKIILSGKKTEAYSQEV